MVNPVSKPVKAQPAKEAVIVLAPKAPPLVPKHKP